MAACAGIKRSGGRCTVSVPAGQTYCHHHDPARAGDRKRAASRAGKSKPSRELADLKSRLSDLADKVLAGEVDRSAAAVAGQLFNTLIRAVAVELKVREVEDLEKRLEELEEAAWQSRAG